MFHADDVAETQNDAHCQRGKGHPPVHRGAAPAVELSDKPVGLAALLLYSVHEWNNRSGNHGMDPPVSQSCIGAARAKKLWQAAKQLYRKKKKEERKKNSSRAGLGGLLPSMWVKCIACVLTFSLRSNR